MLVISIKGVPLSNAYIKPQMKLTYGSHLHKQCLSCTKILSRVISHDPGSHIILLMAMTSPVICTLQLIWMVLVLIIDVV